MAVRTRVEVIPALRSGHVELRSFFALCQRLLARPWRIGVGHMPSLSRRELHSAQQKHFAGKQHERASTFRFAVKRLCSNRCVSSLVHLPLRSTNH